MNAEGYKNLVSGDTNNSRRGRQEEKNERGIEIEGEWLRRRVNR